MRPAAYPIACYVTDRSSVSPGAPGDWCAALLGRVADAARAGIAWVQLREKDLGARPLLELARDAISRANAAAQSPAGPATRILINDRLDVALAAGAAGVHLGETSLPVREAVRAKSRARNEEFLVGASCHSLEAALRAAGEGADYLFFGPVFATPSKAAFGPPQGLARLADVCRAAAVPVLAIGGITADNASACIAAGAAGVAAIRLFQQAPDLGALRLSLEACRSKPSALP